MSQSQGPDAAASESIDGPFEAAAGEAEEDAAAAGGPAPRQARRQEAGDRL